MRDTMFKAEHLIEILYDLLICLLFRSLEHSCEWASSSWLPLSMSMSMMMMVMSVMVMLMVMIVILMLESMWIIMRISNWFLEII